MNEESAAMRAAESAEPGSVYRRGWLRLGCPDCGEVLWDSYLPEPGIAEVLQQFHRIACQAR